MKLKTKITGSKVHEVGYRVFEDYEGYVISIADYRQGFEHAMEWAAPLPAQQAHMLKTVEDGAG